jgi:hypothetical protein
VKCREIDDDGDDEAQQKRKFEFEGGSKRASERAG